MISLNLLPHESGFGLACRTAIARSLLHFDRAHIAWKTQCPDIHSTSPSARKRKAWVDAGEGWWGAHLTPAEKDYCSLAHLHDTLFAGTSGRLLGLGAGILPSKFAAYCPACTRGLIRRFGVATWVTHHNAGGVSVCADHGERLFLARARDAAILPGFVAKPPHPHIRKATLSPSWPLWVELEYARLVASLVSEPKLRSSAHHLRSVKGMGGLQTILQSLVAELGTERQGFKTVPSILRILCYVMESQRNVLEWFRSYTESMPC